jgi:hypothetical protein
MFRKLINSHIRRYSDTAKALTKKGNTDAAAYFNNRATALQSLVDDVSRFKAYRAAAATILKARIEAKDINLIYQL